MTNLKPDTTIPCTRCGGSGRRGWRECGACLGHGLSTAPWDQRRNGTTITIWDDDTPERKAMTGLTVEAVHTPIHYKRVGMAHVAGRCMLVSWANRDYRGEQP